MEPGGNFYGGRGENGITKLASPHGSFQNPEKFMTTAINDLVNSISAGVRANTQLENQWLANAPPEMQAQMRSQILMQKEQELVQMLVQAMKQTSEMSKSTIRNIGG
jgi:hypothetical protein